MKLKRSETLSSNRFDGDVTYTIRFLEISEIFRETGRGDSDAIREAGRGDNDVIREAGKACGKKYDKIRKRVN
jgi:hypothetical protein